MALGMDVTLRDARLQVIADAIDAGATDPGYMEIYAGTQPATGAAVTDQTLLGTVTFSDPCAASLTGGVLTFAGVTGANAVADGTATWARVYDGDGAFVLDMDVGASGAAVTLNTTFVVTGGPISVVSAVINEGNA